MKLLFFYGEKSWSNVSSTLLNLHLNLCHEEVMQSLLESVHFIWNYGFAKKLKVKSLKKQLLFTGLLKTF